MDFNLIRIVNAMVTIVTALHNISIISASHFNS